MKVLKKIIHKHGSEIHLAKVCEGGNASWGASGDPKDSIRLAWYKENPRKFDPISSGELPIWGLKDILEVAAQEDMFSKSELAEMIGQLTSAIYKKP